MIDLSTLIGKPYEVGAEGPDAFDCYGLARTVLRENYGQGLPEVPRSPGQRPSTPALARGLARVLLTHPERPLWSARDTPQDGALVLMGNVDGRDYHLGVYVQNGRVGLVLHADEVAGVVADEVINLGIKGFHNVRFFARS